MGSAEGVRSNLFSRSSSSASSVATSVEVTSAPSAFEVANVLGPGFLEKVYERALIRELGLRHMTAKRQVSFPVSYKGQYVGEYIADLVVEEQILVELKCVDRLGSEHLAQCINYLRASGLPLALLINFQKPKLEWKRVLLNHPRPCDTVPSP